MRTVDIVHVVRQGETLSRIAQRYLGDGFLWPNIHRSNRWIDNPDLIHPGDWLQLRNVTVQRAREAIRIP